MARKKIEIPPLINGLKDSHAVQKSLPLFSLWQSELTLSEFKLLDIYLSRINSNNSDNRTVLIEKGELEHALGIKKINQKSLEVRLMNLMRSVVKITDNDVRKGFRLVTLFEESECELDSNNLWQIKLEATQKAMKYFFDIEKIGYLRYKLRSIINLSSRYSYVLFIYLEHNRFRKSFEVDVDQLKQILNCTSNTYISFYRFNDLVLKKCQKELHEKTDIRYTYEPIKKGRQIVAVRFVIETLTDFELPKESEQLVLVDSPCQEYSTEHLTLLAEACNNEFSEDEMKVVFSLLGSKVLFHENGLAIAQYHFLAQNYTEMNRQHNKKAINHRFAYIKKMIEKG